MLCWYKSVGRIKSWAVMIKLSVPALRTAAFRHLWVFNFNRSKSSSVGRALDCKAGGHEFDSQGRTITQGLKND